MPPNIILFRRPKRPRGVGSPRQRGPWRKGWARILRAVTDRRLVVALPNMAWALYRLGFLFTGRLGEKYKVLPYGSDDGDRHRWLTTAEDCAKYIDEFAAAKRDVASVRTVPTLESGKRHLFAAVVRAFGASPQLYAPTLVFVIERN